MKRTGGLFYPLLNCFVGCSSMRFRCTSGSGRSCGWDHYSAGWIAEEEASGLSKGPGLIAIPSGNITQIKSDDSVDFMSGGDFVEETWYTVDYSVSNNSSLYTVDCDTGDYTLIGSTGVHLTGFTYDLTSQTAYASAYDSTSTLYTIARPRRR